MKVQKILKEEKEKNCVDMEQKELPKEIDPMEITNREPELGAKEQPLPKKVEVPKATLDESLFEDWSDVKDARHSVYEILQNALVGNNGVEDNVALSLASDGIGYDADWALAEYNESDPLQKKLNLARDSYLIALLDVLFANAPIEESVNENLEEDDLDDFNHAFYNAIADVCFKFRNKPLSRRDIEYAYNFFDSHFYDSDDAEEYGVDESLKEDIFSHYDDGLVTINQNLVQVKPCFLNKREAEKLANRVIALSKSLKEGLDEAKDSEDNDIWTLVYEELCPTNPNFAKKTKFPEISLGDRYGEEKVEINYDGDIVVYGKDEDAFELAKQVCDVYNCEFDGPHESAKYKLDQNPDFALYAKIKVPGYEG